MALRYGRRGDRASESGGAGAFRGLSAAAGNPAFDAGGHDPVLGVAGVWEGREALHALGVDVHAPKRLGDGAPHRVHAPASEREVARDAGKVHGVEPGAFEVDEAPEAHPLALGGGGFFDGDEVADDGDDVANAVGEVAGEYAAADDGLGLFGQQQEGRTEGEAQQLPLVEGVRERRGVERRQDVGARFGGREQLAGAGARSGGQGALSRQELRHVGGTGSGPCRA